MSAERESYVLNQVITLLKKEQFFDGKSDEAIERFCGEILKITKYRCSPIDIFEGHEDLRYCASCLKVVEQVYPEFESCAECKIAESQGLIDEFTEKYKTKEYFEDPNKEYDDVDRVIYKLWVQAEQDRIETQELIDAKKNKMTANITKTLHELNEKVAKAENAKKSGKIEVAKKAIAKGLDDETISELTELTIEEIQSLRKS